MKEIIVRGLHLFSEFNTCESETRYLAGAVCTRQWEQQRTCCLLVCGAHGPEDMGTFLLAGTYSWREKRLFMSSFGFISLLMILSLIIISLLKWQIFSVVACQSVAPTPIILLFTGKH